MIPILFSESERDFVSEGLGRLTECASWIVREERNGVFEGYFDYPQDGERFSDIKIGCHVMGLHDNSNKPQAFTIYRQEDRQIDGLSRFYFQHLTYDLTKVVVQPYTASSCAEAVSKIVPNSLSENRFTFWTDKNVSGRFNLKQPASVRNVLGGMQGSILDTYGKADLEWDMYTVRVYQNRGRDNGVEIRYGKNLASLERDRNNSESYNSVVPFWLGEDGTMVMLPEGIVYGESEVTESLWKTHDLDVIQTQADEDLLFRYYTVKAVPLDLTDEFEERPTETQLRTKAQEFIDSQDAYRLKENITVDFVQLWETDEYKDIANLQRVNLCDTVTIIYDKLDIRAKAKVIATEYDGLAERYTLVGLGEPKQTLAETLAVTIKQDVTSTITRDMPTVSMMEAAISEATRMLAGGFGGHIVYHFLGDGTPSEMLILDTPDESAATNIILLNKNGIGFSTDGGHTYSTAWTIDGKFNADFISSGSVQANLIQGGILMDLAGKNYWNLNTGEFSFDIDVPEGGVTRGDLAAAEERMRRYTDAAEEDAKTYSDGLIDGIDNKISASISANNETLRTEFRGEFAPKGSTISNIIHWYYISTSPTQLLGGEWIQSETIPHAEGMYIWERQETVTADGTHTMGSAVCITGNAGEDGATGADALYLYITSNRSTATPKEDPTTVTLTACVGQGDTADTDPNGTKYTYAWYKTADDGDECYYRRGKNQTLVIDSDCCEDRASMRFRLSDDVTEFYLRTQSGSVIQTQSGSNLEVW